MLTSYEAIYDHGQIRWLDAPPDVAEARLIVTLLPLTPPCLQEKHCGQAPQPGDVPTTAAVDALLASTAGAWGKRSLTEVQGSIESQRNADWGDD